MPNGTIASRGSSPRSEAVMWKWSPMWNEPNTSTPARLPVASGTQTLKFAADIRTTCQPRPRSVRSAARLSRMMSNGWVCRLSQATSASES